MRLDVVTIFPEYLDPLRHALLGRAIERGILEVGVHDLRAWTHDVHKAVDDTPYGGGPGMVMKPTVWGPALDDVAALTGPAAVGASLRSAQAHVPGTAPDAPASPPPQSEPAAAP
ncbi:MAG: tRNA (guanosine(37)-N1)-methyltransferase TrmD, partial [Corynebacterium sp.]|nr:tRNA (guanosine(37)-N1)-methyltransferase TrmD [Corynebacterium sp.]